MFGWILVALSLQTVSVATVAQGTHSQIGEPRQVVVRTADEWRMLWKAHSPDPVPAIDFDRSMVVGVFLGTQPTAGYGVEIKAVRAADSARLVEYVERRPGPGALVAQVLTFPFHLISLPHALGNVEFRKVDP